MPVFQKGKHEGAVVADQQNKNEGVVEYLQVPSNALHLARGTDKAVRPLTAMPSVPDGGISREAENDVIRTQGGVYGKVRCEKVVLLQGSML